MSLRRLHWHLRRPGFGIAMALLLLVAGAFCFSDFHPAHSHADRHVHHHADGSSHHHDHNDESRSENCAICFFHSASMALDLAVIAPPRPELSAVGELLHSSRPEPAHGIVILWAGRAPPFSSAS